MAFPLDPVHPNLFIGHYEQHCLIQEEILSVLFYKKCADVFCLFKPSGNAENVLDFSIFRHKNFRKIEKFLF